MTAFDKAWGIVKDSESDCSSCGIELTGQNISRVSYHDVKPGSLCNDCSDRRLIESGVMRNPNSPTKEDEEIKPRSDFNPEIRIVPQPCPNCGDMNMEAYLLNEEDMVMNCWECGFTNHTDTDSWEWDEFGR